MSKTQVRFPKVIGTHSRLFSIYIYKDGSKLNMIKFPFKKNKKKLQLVVKKNTSSSSLDIYFSLSLSLSLSRFRERYKRVKNFGTCPKKLEQPKFGKKGGTKKTANSMTGQETRSVLQH